MAPKPFLIMQTGSFSEGLSPIVEKYGDMGRTFLDAAGLGPDEAKIWQVFRDEPLAEPPDAFAGVIITGSSAMLTEPESWMETAAAWLRGAVSSETPTLGVCFGHQLLAHALGGRVGRNPNGLESGTVDVRLAVNRADDDLFRILPEVASFQAHHYESVINLPQGTEIIGFNGHDAFHAVRYAPKVWGVQFHPEITAEIMRDITAIEIVTKVDTEFSYQKVLDGVRETPLGPVLLRHFKAIATESG